MRDIADIMREMAGSIPACADAADEIEKLRLELERYKLAATIATESLAGDTKHPMTRRP